MSSQTSSVRGVTPMALQKPDGALSRSMIRQRRPCRTSSAAMVRPTGPAPTTRTSGASAVLMPFLRVRRSHSTTPAAARAWSPQLHRPSEQPAPPPARQAERHCSLPKGTRPHNSAPRRVQVRTTPRAAPYYGCQRERTDAWQFLLLRLRRDRPRCRPAWERYEVAASNHSMTSSASASSVGGIVRPRSRAVSALMTSSNLLDCTTGRSAGLAPLSTRPT
jgi:hypothetical protein